jgi:hypothetical protein
MMDEKQYRAPQAHSPRHSTLRAIGQFALYVTFVAVCWHYWGDNVGLGPKVAASAVILIAAALVVYDEWSLPDDVRWVRDRREREERAGNGIAAGWILGLIGVALIVFTATNRLPQAGVWIGVGVCALGLLATRRGRRALVRLRAEELEELERTQGN